MVQNNDNLSEENKKFLTQYTDFLGNIEKAIEKRLGDNAKDPLNKLAKSVFEGLKSEEGTNAVCDAAQKVDAVAMISDGDAATNAKVTELLTYELEFYNSRYGGEPEDNDEDLQDAATIKESIHKLLSKYLPDWVSKLFVFLTSYSIGLTSVVVPEMRF